MRLHKRHETEHWNRDQTVERIKSLPKQGDAKGPMEQVGVPDGCVNRWLRDRSVDPPDVPDVHETITVIREEMGGEIADQRPGQYTKHEKIK